MAGDGRIVTLVLDADLAERVDERRGSMPISDWFLKVARESSRRPSELRANFGSLEHRNTPREAGPTMDAGRAPDGEQRSDGSPSPVPERVLALLEKDVVLEGVRREDGAIEFTASSFTASRSDQGFLRPVATVEFGSLRDDPGVAEKGSDSGGILTAGTPFLA